MSGNSPAPDAGSKRAAEMSAAMMDIPTYADDSIFFIMRYASKCQQTLRKVDYDEFMKRVWALGEAMESKAGSETDGGGGDGDEAARDQKRAGLRERALEMVGEYPDLVRDFDRFMTASRAVSKSGSR